MSCKFPPNRYNDVLLKRIFVGGGVIYSPSRESFITRGKPGFPKVEDYTDIVGKVICCYICSFLSSVEICLGDRICPRVRYSNLSESSNFISCFLVVPHKMIWKTPGRIS